MIETHPRFRNGEILPAGTRLFRIDPVDYELPLAQAQFACTAVSRLSGSDLRDGGNSQVTDRRYFWSHGTRL
jgi:hypothetical protein